MSINSNIPLSIWTIADVLYMRGEREAYKSLRALICALDSDTVDLWHRIYESVENALDPVSPDGSNETPLNEVYKLSTTPRASLLIGPDRTTITLPENTGQFDFDPRSIDVLIDGWGAIDIEELIVAWEEKTKARGSEPA